MIIELNKYTDNLKSRSQAMTKVLDKNTIVLIWAVWCPHCVNMKDDWNRVKKVVPRGVHIIEVESGNYNKLQNEHPLLYQRLNTNTDRMYFPMIKMWKNKDCVEYEGERNFKDMNTAIQKYYKTHNAKKDDKMQKNKKKLPTPKGKKQGDKKSAKKGGDVKGGVPPMSAYKMRALQKDLNNYINDLLMAYKENTT